MEPEPVARLVAARVRRLRRERGWSAEQLAKACGDDGPTRSTIAKIESGVRKSVTAEEIAVLARALEVSPAELLAPGPDDEVEPARDSLQAVVDALSRLPSMRDRAARHLAVDLVRRRLGAGFEVLEQSTSRLHLYALVVACEAQPDGLWALLEAVELIEGGSAAVEQLREAVEELAAPAWLPAHARAELLELLSERDWPRLAEDYRAVTGPYVPEPGGAAEPRTYVQQLEQLNAPSSGIPPLLSFVARLAERAEPGLAARLHAWTHTQAAMLGVPVPPPPAGVRGDRPGAFLVVQLERDAVERDGYLVQHWTQLTTDEVRRGGDFTGSLPEVQRHVAELVAHAEAGWAADAAFIRLEFVLPRELLNLPVDQWPGSLEGEPPQPLGLRNQVVVRSLDRLRRPHWRRNWRLRWELLDQRESLADNQLVLWSAARRPEEQRRLDAELAMSDHVVMVLPHQPAMSDTDEVLIGLRAGLPVMLWLRDLRFTDSFEAEIGPMLTAGRDLPEAARLLRGKAFSATDPDTHVGSHVTLLWDDPRRALELTAPLELRPPK
jgi:transcriptional regulator with XRE-family HTH domain